MKISTRGRYAVMAMADMAQVTKNGAEGPVSLSDISERQEISLNYLEQIFGDLRRAGLVESRRGKAGGYLLAAPLEAIRIGDVIRAVDEPVEVTLRRGGGLFEEKRALLDARPLGASRRHDTCFFELDFA